MDLSQDQKKKLFELFAALREETIRPEQFRHLDAWLMESRQARMAWLDYSTMCGCLRSLQLAAYHPRSNPVSSVVGPETPIHQDISDSALWKMMAETERTADTVYLKPQAAPAQPLPPVQIASGFRKINKVSLVTFLTTVAALAFMILYVHLNPRVNMKIATLTDSIDARWSGVPFDTSPGSRFTLNSGPVRLERGVVSFVYDQGVNVVIEGPARFEMTTPTEIILEQGKLYAYVTETGAGFSVKTQNTKVIDLGTEFGVSYDETGDTRLHVFKGKTKLIAGSNHRVDAVQDVFGGSAREVGNAGQGIRIITLNQTEFARAIDSQKRVVWRGESLSLADMVAGGNGMGTGTQEGIRWDNGKFATRRDYYVGLREQGTGTFIPVQDGLFIEGVFMPDGTSGPNAVTKDGTILWDAPPTSDGYCYNITTSGMISRGSGRTPEHQQMLEGRLCGTPDNPVIAIHPNAGITFNLQAIRSYYGGRTLGVFTAFCGLSQTVVGYAAQAMPNYVPTASFYVLVDGRERFSKIDMNPAEGVCRIEIELFPQDRYLTLATTEGTDGKITYGWCVFAQPELRME